MAEKNVVSAGAPEERLTGTGWIIADGIRIGRVTYAVTVQRVDAAHGASLKPTLVALEKHSLKVEQWRDRSLTLILNDGRAVCGMLSHDGARLVRTGSIV